MIKDYFKCEKCEYKTNRKRGVIKCVFLSVVFSLLAFILGVAVGLQIPPKTARGAVISASAEEVPTMSSIWDLELVQAPGYPQVPDGFNDFDFLGFVSALDAGLSSSSTISSYTLDYDQGVYSNSIVVTGKATSFQNGITVWVDWHMDSHGRVAPLYFEYSSSDSNSAYSGISYIVIVGDGMEYMVESSISPFYNYGVNHMFYTDFEIMFDIAAMSDGTFSFALTNVGARDRWEDIPVSYLIDYYYNLGLASSGSVSEGYTDADLQAEYNRGYNAGNNFGYGNGYNEGYYIGYQAGISNGSASEEELQAKYDEGYSTGYVEGYEDGIAFGINEGYLDGKEDGFLEALEKISVGNSLDITFYNTNYFHLLQENYPSTMSQVEVSLTDGKYLYFSSYYSTLINQIATEKTLSSDDKNGLYAFNAHWEFRFSTPVTVSSLSILRFSSLAEILPFSVGEGLSLVFTDGSVCPLSWSTLEDKGNGYTVYGLDLSAFSQIDDGAVVSALAFDSYVNVVYLFEPDVDYQENYSPGIYGLRFYDITAEKIDSVSFARGYAEGEKYGKSISDAKVAKENFDKGYSDGLAKAEKFDFTHAVSTVIGAPITVVKEFLNFEILGVNMLGFLSGVITLLIILKCLKFVL